MGFFLWEDWPQPTDGDPLPWLIHQGDSPDGFADWQSKFIEQDLWLPDVIDAYLAGEQIVGEFMKYSLTAIDGLVYILEHINEEPKPRQQESPKAGSRRRAPKSRQKEAEVMFLATLLMKHHTGENSEHDLNKPLSSDEIAELLEWKTSSGKPCQSKVSRRMADIFGPAPMKRYAAMFNAGTVSKGFFNAVTGRFRDIDGIDVGLDLD